VHFCCSLVIVTVALVSLSMIFFITGLVSVSMLPAYPILVFICVRLCCVFFTNSLHVYFNMWAIVGPMFFIAFGLLCMKLIERQP